LIVDRVGFFESYRKLIECRTDFCEELHSDFGQCQLSAALDKTLAETLLKGGYLPAHGAMRHAKRLCREGERKRASDSFKTSQSSEGEVAAFHGEKKIRGA
jgi:hypothetical protein